MTLPKVLIVCTREWFGSARLPEALTRVGFEVASFSFTRGLITHSRHVRTQFVLPKAPTDDEILGGLEAALLAFAPTLVIPGDDPAVELLHALAHELSGRVDVAASVRECLARSLSAAAQRAVVQSRKGLHALAAQLSLRTPQQAIVEDADSALQFAREQGFPIVLKVENSCAGFGTSICRDDAAVHAGFAHLRARYGLRDSSGQVVVQKFIEGRTAMRAVVALDGVVLGGLSAIKRETHPAPTGPSTVVEFFEHEEMSASVEALARSLGLAGFASFDFMVESASDQAYLIELNPRPTPICHLGGAFGADLCALLFERLTGLSARGGRPRHAGNVVALFPQEWIRDPASPHLREAFHDVPWDDPKLVEELVRMGSEQMGWGHLRREENRREGFRQRAAR